MALFDFLTQDIAIDLGTANTIIIHNDKVVVDEPSIVAMDRTNGRIIAVGKSAQMMHGKTHENIKTIRPLRDGVIADFEAAESMIKEMIKIFRLKNGDTVELKTDVRYKQTGNFFLERYGNFEKKVKVKCKSCGKKKKNKKVYKYKKNW